jgi:hypothetical protein
MQTIESPIIDIDESWGELRDQLFYRDNYGNKIGKPRDVMECLLKEGTTKFEGCLNHELEFMWNIDRLDPVRRACAFTLNSGLYFRALDRPPFPTIEEKIKILRKAFKIQMHTCEYHQTFNDVMAYYWGVERLRQQIGYKLCPGQKIFYFEISELIRLMELAITKLDIAMINYYAPFYDRIMKHLLTPEEESNKRLHKSFQKLERELAKDDADRTRTKKAKK